MKPQIEWKFMLVTAAMALQWLTKNNANRKLRLMRVCTLGSTMSRGKWKETHQGIAIGADGAVIDGQHRLTAIANTGVAVHMWVAFYGRVTTALGEPIDQIVPRSQADLLGEHQALIAICRQAWNVVLETRHLQPSLDDMRDLTEWMRPHFEGLIDVCGAKSGEGRTSATVRLGVIARAMTSDSEVVLAQYRAFVLMDVELMWKSTACLYRQLATLSSKVSGYEADADRLARAWKAFDVAKSSGNFLVQNAKAAVTEVANALIANGFPATCLSRKPEASQGRNPKVKD